MGFERLHRARWKYSRMVGKPCRSIIPKTTYSFNPFQLSCGSLISYSSARLFQAQVECQNGFNGTDARLNASLFVAMIEPHPYVYLFAMFFSSFNTIQYRIQTLRSRCLILASLNRPHQITTIGIQSTSQCCVTSGTCPIIARQRQTRWYAIPPIN